MLTGLDSILLSRESECVISHRMKHIESLKSLISGVNVTGYVSERVSHVKSCT